MTRGFMSLSNDELKFLDGRVSGIDLQNGCPVQCVVCGTDAPKHKGNISWDHLLGLSDSILEVKDAKNIDLLLHDLKDVKKVRRKWPWSKKLKKESYLFFYYRSDPVYYHSKDGDVKRTIYDVINVMGKRHRKCIWMQTSGWKPGQNHMQEAIEKIVEDKDLHQFLEFGYSIKTVSTKVIKEYEKFKKGYSGDIKKIVRSFIRESEYVRMVIENFKTLRGLKIDPALQCFNDEDIRENLSFNPIHKNHAEIFSIDAVYGIYSYASRKAYNPLVSPIRGLFPDFSTRRYSGVGKAISLGMVQNEDLGKYKSLLLNDSAKYETEPVDNEINALVTSEGALEIFYGQYNDMARIIIPKDVLLRKARNCPDKELSHKYSIMAELQGKNILK